MASWHRREVRTPLPSETEGSNVAFSLTPNALEGRSTQGLLPYVPGPWAVGGPGCSLTSGQEVVGSNTAAYGRQI